jgi:dipeptidyl aminopeptidase/acylaminoacyl peptidase
MKLPLYVMLIALCLAPSIAAEKGYNPAVKQYTIEQFMNTEAIGGSSFSADQRLILYASNKSGIYNAYTVPVSGGPATQLTSSTGNSIFPVSFFPSDNRILYTSDQGGNEISHIYLRNEDGSTKDLTPDEKARAEFYGWAYDKKSFLYGSNKRNEKFSDLYEMDAATLTATMFYQNDSGYNPGAISNDKRYVAFVKTITTNNSEMYLLDRQTGVLEHLSPHEGDATYDPQSFSLDSRKLYFLTNEGSDFTYLKEYSITGKSFSKGESSAWDLMYVYSSRNGKYRVTGINNDARTEIRIVNTKTGKTIKLPEMPDADITSVNISDDEKLMTMYVNGSRSPSNLYVYNFETRKYLRLTNTMNPEIDQDDLVESEVVRYPSYDGLAIPALFYKPLQVRKGDKAPAIVMVHGGPGGQTRVGYSALKQYLVNHGYVVIDVNNRGSSGYGKAFFKMDDMKHGEADLGDCVEAKKFLAKTGYVDPAKIGIMGGSYGGYMVLAALTFRPEEFAVGVDLFGVANWLRTLRSVPPWWESFRKALYEEMGNPETDSMYLYRISPLFHAEKITKPMIVLQGANDPRVLKVESDEIVEKARKNGVPVEYVIFPDEGHGFVKKENQIKSYKAVLDFLDKYLKKS